MESIAIAYSMSALILEFRLCVYSTCATTLPTCHALVLYMSVCLTSSQTKNCCMDTTIAKLHLTGRTIAYMSPCNSILRYLVGLSSAISQNYVCIIDELKEKIEANAIANVENMMEFVTTCILNETAE